jgi:uncharacterized membrane protein YgdD (TMEM256/DUF423 family)
MNKNHVIIAAIMGALSVALGAFGAHGLKAVLSPELLETYKTGILYHLIHSVVLLTLSINTKDNLKTSFYFFLVGIILFSFSLYIYALTGITAFAMITPIGGIALILGWLMIIVSIIKKKH